MCGARTGSHNTEFGTIYIYICIYIYILSLTLFVNVNISFGSKMHRNFFELAQLEGSKMQTPLDIVISV